MKQNKLPLIKFNPKLPRLSETEKKVLKILVEAGELIAPLYQEQEKQFKTISKEDIDKATKKDSEAVSPYTVVEKVNNEWVVTPYHIKYARFLKPIADKLNKAASLTNNKAFGVALKLRAKALMDGSYEKAISSWINLKPYTLDISIGPLHHYDDRLPFSKASYHAWVGVIDREGTDRYNNYKKVTLGARRKAVLPKERIDLNQDQIKAKVLDVILFSGIMAETKFVGLNLPINVDLVEKYGAVATLFNQPNDLRMKEQILPTFNKLFSKEFKEGFNQEDLRRGYLRVSALHGLAHSYLYYKNSYKNLKDLFYFVYELSATILAFRLAGTLLLKDRITEKMFKSMIVAYTSRCFYLMQKGTVNRFMVNYVTGNTIYLNFMLESGAIKRSNGSITINFTKIFVSMLELSDILENLLANGVKREVEVLIKRYS